ncbi:uncharacterized protein K02A2.6-like [Uloborus diversus]|uniref:uncharacterized protein K02A2.6-like n=1 Tax=Uloborus diversus TaxID=327109 RepID=UPI002409107D|nr:uncharacterized protein K02A2.6-like [Uloborus diversus]
MTAEFAAPIVPVLKQDGRIRICGDFKLTTNKITELEQYPLPNIEDLFAQLSGGTLFSKLDLRDAYCQLQLDEDSKNLVVINTQKGLFRYTRLPFGVASAPAVFQREMEKILQGLQGASCYLDDLLVTGKDRVEHLQNLNAVLSRLQEAGMKLHPEKCEFWRSSVEYLGHRIDKDGLHPVESKVEAIACAPDPRNVDELRSFIGLITYYAKFLPNMATLLAPLYELLKEKQAWEWGATQKEAFTKVKETLRSSSLLMHFDNAKEVVLACDASPYGLGAVLSHETKDGDRPIAFASRSLTKAERNYSHIEKEALALVFGVTRFRKYLLGRNFTLLTDHRPLVNLLSEDKPVPTVAAARIQRWALTLSAYSYKIKFRKGNLHSNADACSRLPLATRYPDPPVPAESVLLLKQFDSSPVTSHLIAREIESSSDLKLLRSYIARGFPKSIQQNLKPFFKLKDELSIEGGIILRGSRVFIPPKFKRFIIDELHAAHQGIVAIKSLARSYVWWPSIDSDLEAKVRECAICQQNASAPPAKQVSWPVPDQSWERIHIDHAGPVEGHMLLIIVDAKTKWLEVARVSSTSANVTIMVLRDLFARFGIPKSIVSDNGPGFSSDEFCEFLSHNGISDIKTAPYHPNSNGIAERAVRTVKSALKRIREGTFEERLVRFLFNYRNTPHASTGISPAFGMFGRPLRSRLDLLRNAYRQREVHSDPGRFRTGDLVWVRNFRQGPKWIEGCILTQMGKIMCKVETARGTWIRHADQIRRRIGSSFEESSIKPRPATASSNAGEEDAVPVVEEEKPGDSNEPPLLSPPSHNPVPKEHPPVLSPQCKTPTQMQPLSTPIVAQQPRKQDSMVIVPRRSTRNKVRPCRLNL